MFSQEQFASLLRTAMQMLGAWAVTKGYTDDQTALAIGGGLVALGTTIYSVYIRRKAGIVASAAALPEVREIVTTQKMAAQVDDPTVRAG
jgi:hypothetical protein